MARTPKALPLNLPDVFTALEADRLRIRRDRLRRDDILWLAPGIYARKDSVLAQLEPESTHSAALWHHQQRQKTRLFARHLDSSQFFSHHTAASIWSLPMVPRPDDRLDIGHLLPARGSRNKAVWPHRFTPGSVEVVKYNGLPVLSPASTWVVLAQRLGRASAVALGDAVIHTPRMPGTRRTLRAPHSTVEEIGRLIAIPYRRDRAKLTGYLELLSPRAASPPESHLRLLLRDWGTPAPALDFDVRDRHGRLLGCSEFAFPKHRLAVEYEGDHHRTESGQWERDITKYRDYANEGWEVLRVTRGLLYREPDMLQRQIWAALNRRQP